MGIRPWEIAFGLVYFVVCSPPLYIYHMILKKYKKQARALEARKSLSKTSELERQAREEANKSHGFMRLPGELRNRIYSLCMVSETVIDPIWGPIYSLKQLDEKDDHLEHSSFYPKYISQLYPELGYGPYEATWSRMGNMSQVCRGLRIEAMKHFYGNNIFKLPVGKHLHERRPPERGIYATLAVWKPSFWRQSVVEPAGKFASRRFYTAWVQKRPREAFPVVRLLLHDYRLCPHFIRRHNSHRRPGSCMILLDFEKRAVHVVRGMDQRDFFNLWNCDLCWIQFIAKVIGLNSNEEMKKLFAEFHGKMDADTAIKVVDGMRRILEAEYMQCDIRET